MPLDLFYGYGEIIVWSFKFIEMFRKIKFEVVIVFSMWRSLWNQLCAAEFYVHPSINDGFQYYVGQWIYSTIMDFVKKNEIAKNWYVLKKSIDMWKGFHFKIKRLWINVRNQKEIYEWMKKYHIFYVKLFIESPWI